jgi:hypothetical protein
MFENPLTLLSILQCVLFLMVLEMHSFFPLNNIGQAAFLTET